MRASVLNRFMAGAARGLRLVAGLGVVQDSDDAPRVQRLKITGLNGEVREGVRRLQHYGFSSRPLDGAAGVWLAVGGSRNHLVFIADEDGRYRKRELEKGEVCLYTDEGDYLFFKRGRIVELVAGVKIKATAPEVEVVASTKVVFTTPLVECSNKLHVKGPLEVDQLATLSGDAEISGIQFSTHTHPGVLPGGASTGEPQ